MGACATKPKDLKGEAPEAAQENVPAAEVAVEGEEEVASKDMAEEEVKKEVEGGADDDADRRRSLSNLFKEGEQVKEEASQVTEASGLSEAKPEEVEKLVDASVMSKIEKALEVVSITAEAPKGETSEKKIEEVKSETKTPDEKKVEEVIPLEVVSITAEAPKVETSEEKKIEAAKSETKTPDEKNVEEVIPAVASPAEKKI